MVQAPGWRAATLLSFSSWLEAFIGRLGGFRYEARARRIEFIIAYPAMSASATQHNLPVVAFSGLRAGFFFACPPVAIFGRSRIERLVCAKTTRDVKEEAAKIGR